VWHILSSTIFNSQNTDMLPGLYRGRHFVRCYSKWLCGDANGPAIGGPSYDIASHWGAKITWEFSVNLLYNEGRGVIFHELELVALTGRVAAGANPSITSEYTVDGETWSLPKPRTVGVRGDRTKRLVWMRQGHMSQVRGQRFRGDSDAMLSVARLEARIEPLTV
jgi:hypothetical protein